MEENITPHICPISVHTIKDKQPQPGPAKPVACTTSQEKLPKAKERLENA